MEEEGMEGGGLLLRRSLLQESKPNFVINGDPATPSATALVAFSTFFAVCGSFCFGCAVGYSSPTQFRIMEDLDLSLAQYSVFGSTLTLGGTIGAVFCGKIASLIGRRCTMWVSAIFCILGWIGIAFAKNAWLLYVGRFSLGFGVGLTSYVTPLYIAEVAPKSTRGGFSFATQLMASSGFSLVYFIGSVTHWRILALISAIPCVVQIIGLCFVPESPRWLAEIGQHEEFEAALQRLRGKETDISEEAVEIRDNIKTFEQYSKTGILDLFHRRYAHSLTIGVGLMLLLQLGGSSPMTYYASSILDKADFSSRTGTTTLAVIVMPTALLGLVLVDRLGRRPLLMASSLGMCLFSFLLGLSFWLKDVQKLKTITPTLTFIGIVGYITTLSLGMAGLPWIIMSEIFPVNIKASAGSLVTLVHWSTGWLVAYIFNFMLQWSSSGTFFIFSGICGATILFEFFLVPETKGKTPEEIQAQLAHSHQPESRRGITCSQIIKMYCDL